jgi:hypothetical protein
MNRRMGSDRTGFLIGFYIFLLILLFISLFPLVSAYSPPECEYGLFDAWFSIDGETWLNSTVEDVVLSRGQPFFIRTIMSTSQDSVRVGFFFTEPGEYNAAGSTFKILDENLSMFDPFLYGTIKKSGDVYEHIWSFQVKNDTDWFQASAPLNVFVQFDALIKGKWISDEISFTIVCPFIIEEVYEYDTDMNGTFFDPINETPEGASIFAGIIILICYLKRRL